MSVTQNTIARTILVPAIESAGLTDRVITDHLEGVGLIGEGFVAYRELEREEHAAVVVHFTDDGVIMIECLFLSDGTSVSNKILTPTSIVDALAWLAEQH